MDSQEKITQLEDKLAALQVVNNSQQLDSNDEIDLAELISVLWKQKWKILLLSFVFAIVAAFYALSLPNIYRASSLLMPNAQNQSSSGLKGLASQFGGFASLAGINLGSAGSDKTGYALEVMRSREFIYKFINDNDLKIAIIAVDGWNRERNEFIYNDKVYDIASRKWVREVRPPFEAEPSIQQTYEKFIREHLSVSQDQNTGMVTVTVSHYSPFVAKELVEKLISAINLTIKKQDLDEATKSIAYLEQELTLTNETGMKSMFYQLIEQQQQTLMLTKVRTDYVLKVIDKAVLPETKFKPSRPVIVLAGALVGLLLSSFVVLIISFRGKNDN